MNNWISDSAPLSARAVADRANPQGALERAGAACSLDRPVKLRISCLHVRHKLMYVDERHSPRGRVDVDSDTRVFWCAKTQDAFGPDGEAVSPGDCSNGRACYCDGA